MKLAIYPKRITQLMTIVALSLALVSGILGFSYNYLSGQDHMVARTVSFLHQFFRLGQEQNIPTWYQSSTLLICCLLLALIAYGKREVHAPYARHWVALSIIFLLLSMDESASIHEKASAPVRLGFGVDGFLYYAWVIPALILVLIFVLSYLQFLGHLPAKTRYLFLAAGAIYVGSAAGFELVEGKLDQASGLGILPGASANPLSQVFANTEETLEMLGIAIFVYALLSYIGSQLRDVQTFVTNE